MGMRRELRYGLYTSNPSKRLNAEAMLHAAHPCMARQKCELGEGFPEASPERGNNSLRQVDAVPVRLQDLHRMNFLTM